MSFNLPDGCTDAQIDRHFSVEDERLCRFCKFFSDYDEAGPPWDGMCRLYSVRVYGDETCDGYEEI